LEHGEFPEYSRVRYDVNQAATYDPAAAVLDYVVTSESASGGGMEPQSVHEVVAGNKSKMPSKEQAQAQALANQKNQFQFEKYGELAIIGEPKAVVRAVINIQGAREGIDGLWRIHQVEHVQ
jgi:hypothetical protein